MGTRKVLAVDDDNKILNFLRIILKLRGFEPITTTSGTEAITLVKEKQPDIIILDMLMPEMSGEKVFEHIRGFSQVPAIAFSADQRLAMKSIDVGFNDYIFKPFNPDVLISKIESILKGQK